MKKRLPRTTRVIAVTFGVALCFLSVWLQRSPAQGPPHPSVTLMWTYPVAGTFNVYKRQCPYVNNVPTCAATDPWTKITTTTQKMYVDAAVVMGGTYEYSATATDGVQESVKSMSAVAAIPIDGVSGFQAIPQ